MPINHWPQEDRPREKLLTKGEHALTDAELLAIIFNNGTRGKSALDIAKELISEHGDLKKLLYAPAQEIAVKPGIGRAKYAAMRAAIELGKRCMDCKMTIGQTLDNSIVTQQFLVERLRHRANEVFACIFLDNHLRFIGYEELFHGTVNESSVYPREIVRRGLSHNAAKIILAHNHPSGHALPSQADKDITRLIKQALAIIDINVVDHIIIGNPGNYSFAEVGPLSG